MLENELASILLTMVIGGWSCADRISIKIEQLGTDELSNDSGMEKSWETGLSERVQVVKEDHSMISTWVYKKLLLYWRNSTFVSIHWFSLYSASEISSTSTFWKSLLLLIRSTWSLSLLEERKQFQFWGYVFQSRETIFRRSQV